MPAAFVKKVLKGDEKSWKEAKASASRSGHSGDYKYIAGVSKIIAKNRKKKKMKRTNEGLSGLWKDIKAKFKSNKTGTKEAKSTYNRAQGVQSKLGFTSDKSLNDPDVPSVYRKAASPEGAKKRDTYNKLGVTPDTKLGSKDRAETDKTKAANAAKSKVRSAYTQSYKSGKDSAVRDWKGVVKMKESMAEINLRNILREKLDSWDKALIKDFSKEDLEKQAKERGDIAYAYSGSSKKPLSKAYSDSMTASHYATQAAHRYNLAQVGDRAKNIQTLRKGTALAKSILGKKNESIIDEDKNRLYREFKKTVKNRKSMEVDSTSAAVNANKQKQKDMEKTASKK